MESVHGISVTGGSFPAEIWRLFMEPALERIEPESFPEPSSWPTWKPFTRGKYALTYDPTYVAPESTDTETQTEKQPVRPPPSRTGGRRDGLCRNC
jgi:membrane peptidoglycan carboxypeptidase